MTLVIALFSLLFAPSVWTPLAAAERPTVRALTAFLRLERAHYREQIGETLKFLRRAKAAFEEEGYEVQTLRITTQPFPEYVRGLSDMEALAFLHEYAKLATDEGFLAAIGPGPLGAQDRARVFDLLGRLQAATTAFDSSLQVADEDGVDWDAVRAAARLIKSWESQSPGGLANFRFAATAQTPPETPFYPGSYHLGPGHRFAVALQSANVVAEAFTGARDFVHARERLAEALGGHARAIEQVARTVEKETGWTYVGIDLSPAPLKEVSIGGAVENLLGARFGSSGTMTAAALITGVLRSLPVKRAGYSGLMVPVLEDSVLAQRWSDGTLTLDALLAYSAVCGTGLDTIPLPGDVSIEQLERIIGDMASLAVKLHKPLSARLMPVAGKKPGERTEFADPFLVNAVIQPLH